ncbi:hypothetical protein [Alcaligenes faecalis]|uniref:hypothetical protein n=1 Tax=Alcaligenes faecalis TaxID=511 RepID=UPI0005AB22B8|nr:hypothetical protein [Alcaligenes faecalis]ATH99500.1 hypothetical protein CPY64_07050 [Alcaligenes faecalis]AYZ92287.1 hypothetical protein EGY22_12815 [Alcaligenes faecalis]MCX5593026.1 hypothetical protein [Alcaligenes faecalis]QQC31909.1 hypothetical protein I6H81_14840 [Alcaligenes faecalis]CAJ0903070.1 5-bromo-4-chloroindolyl phosphate hydrolysis protein [Alcaligenes faecalis subsp. faecalis]
MGIKWKEDYNVETQRWFGTAIGFVCGLLCLALFEHLRGYEISWPAWIQAIGSVGAILVAVQVADRQAETSRLLQKEGFDLLSEERRQTRIDSLRALEMTAEIGAKTAIAACDELLKLDLDNYSMRYVKILCLNRRTTLEVAKEVLTRLPVHDYPGVLIGRRVLNIQIAMNKILEAYDFLSGEDEGGLEAVGPDLVLIKEQLNEQLEKMADFMQSYDGRLGVLRGADFY